MHAVHKVTHESRLSAELGEFLDEVLDARVQLDQDGHSALAATLDSVRFAVLALVYKPADLHILRSVQMRALENSIPDTAKLVELCAETTEAKALCAKVSDRLARMVAILKEMS